jgi:glycerophosphoryl diester phosphodiesterase
MSIKKVIAHRGASGYLPEHTLAAKALAYGMNPHFIEQDIVLSKDGVPIIVHDIHLDTTTNVSIMFHDRRRADGRYYVIDFTFEELKTLEVHERIDIVTEKVVYPNRFPIGKSRFGLHSLQEEIELIQGLNKSTNKTIGIYPEIKEPKFHQNEGMDISLIVLKVLNEYGYRTKEDPCLLQCFDSSELQRIRTKLQSNLHLVQLMENESDIDSIPQFAHYADGLGLWLGLLKDGRLMDLAKQNHLFVHAFTLRKEELNDAKSFEDLLNELLFNYDIDGVFTDQPDLVLNFLKRNQ